MHYIFMFQMYMTQQFIPFVSPICSEQEQEIVLWGEYGESFDEAFVLQKSTDHKIVVAILAGLTAGTYLGQSLK